ncbi:MAG TPA: hypothetical protein VGN17_19715 [Bryobacteraceae bacterium]
MRRSSQPQQSLQRLHFSQRWFVQASLVQWTQISVDGSPQMLHAKVVTGTFMITWLRRSV